ncbi:MAG: RIP metalloprotease RseP [FCB group bacterium]
MNILNDVLYLIIVLGILVLIHEFGHFIAARITGTRADTFSIGMGPRLFGLNKITGFTFGNLPKTWDGGGRTDYRLSLLPIGGYVKIAGMVDESMDTKFANTEPQPWEFRSKNTWQKIFILSGGVLMNTLLALFIFAGIAFFQGETILKTTTIGYVKKESISDKIGLKSGDKIVSISGQKVDNLIDCIQVLILKNFGSNKTIHIIRNNHDTIISADSKIILKNLPNKKFNTAEEMFGMFSEKHTFLISVDSHGPAGKAGLQPGDTMIAINGKPIKTYIEFTDIVKSSKNTKLFFTWKRKNILMSDSIVTTSQGLIGVGINEVYTGKTSHKDFNIGESIIIGADRTYGSVILFFGTISQIINGNLSFKENIGGPIKIAKLASQQAKAGFVDFLTFLAILSITLAVINFLPFPALDGGHLVFSIIEGITRKELPVKIKIAVQNVGMAILLLFMAFVVYNDIVR